MILYANDIKRLQDICNHILQNLGENLDSEQLASQFGMSRSTLDRHFYYHYKITLSHFIRKSRLEKAKELIIDKKASISEAANQLGFTDISNFSHSFTRYFGYPPSFFSKEGKE